MKRVALAFLREHGCQAVATEVRCPIARYRVDTAGFCDARDGRPARTIIIECKGQRSDFLRDRRDRDKLLRQRAEVESLLHAIEHDRIKVEEPHLRRGGSALFPELEDWDFAASRLPAYRRVVRRLRRLDHMVYGETKFCLMATYALADRLFVAAPRGLIRPRELPRGWGLLECPRSRLRGDRVDADLFGDSALQVVRPAPPRPAADRFRQRLLRNIAVAASNAAYDVTTGVRRKRREPAGRILRPVAPGLIGPA